MKKLTKGQIIRAIILLPIVIAVGWYFFTQIYIYPKIELWRDGNRAHTTLIKTEEGYTFAEEPYSIEDTAEGYNIVIHMTRK